MTTPDDALARAQAALGRLYRAVAELRDRYGESNPRTFALLSEGPLAEIRRLTREIEGLAGVSAAIVAEAPLWLTLRGERAQWGETASSVLTAFLDALRKGVQAIAVFKEKGKTQGRPEAAIQRACDFEVTAFQAGSFSVGLRLPEPPQLPLFDAVEADLPGNVAHQSLGQYLDAVYWVTTSQPTKALEELLPDHQFRRTVLRAVKPLIPRSNGGIDALMLSGAALSSRGRPALRLTQSDAPRVTAALKETIAPHELQLTGEIREMDLDRRSFTLRNVAALGEVPCRLNEDLGPLAPTYLSKKVRVIGTREAQKALDVLDLEIVEQS